jgi:hypothetical protein
VTEQRVVVATTHPPEYRLHKYWARKPANVLAAYLAKLLPSAGVVVDPFCGSGVFPREAELLGHEVYGFDSNPLAARLSRLTSDPPDLDNFVEAARHILDVLSSYCAHAYSSKLSGRQSIRYVVHAIVVKCPSCGIETTAAGTTRQGRKHACPRCSARLHFNLRTMTRTDAIQVVRTGTPQPITDSEELAWQADLSRRVIGDVDTSAYTFPFVENRRTLTYAGMTTADLFTNRNLSLLCIAAHEIEGIADKHVRNSLQLLLTASVAQCSRLIAFRDGLTGGGPAWSVPGFWVPPIHLESNPLLHLTARLKKFQSGIRSLTVGIPHRSVRIREADAVEGMQSLAAEGKRADLIFLDPPYGDSVPYFEFSVIWNAFLRLCPPLNADMSVSDRRENTMRWDSYEKRLTDVLRACDALLRRNGKLLITFNNHDLRAWKALLQALQASGFACSEVTYQIPAVVPAKAQFSPLQSYQGDLYCVYEKSAECPNSAAHRQQDIQYAMLQCASARGGLLASNLVRRTLAIGWMTNNISAGDFDLMNAWLDDWFSTEGDFLRWRNGLDPTVPDIAETIRSMARRILGRGPRPWTELYASIAVELAPLGVPDALEVRGALGHEMTIKSSVCELRSPQPQLLLFS